MISRRKGLFIAAGKGAVDMLPLSLAVLTLGRTFRFSSGTARLQLG